MKKKNRLFLLGTGYPWYGKSKNFSYPGYDTIKLASRKNGKDSKPLHYRGGADQKVRVWIELLP